MPLVSAIIPNYNHARFLRQRVRSVLEQTHRDLEVVLLDDASTDGSAAVIAEFAADPRVRVVTNAVNGGSTFAQWNRGARLAGGEYLWFAESDDYSDPRFLETLVGMLEANPACGMACCESWYVYADAEGADLPVSSRTNQSHLPENERWRGDYVVAGWAELAEQLVEKNTMPNASAAVLRRSAFERAGGAAESMRLCGDWMLWAKILAGSDLAHVGEPLNFYRCHTAAVRRKNFASPRTQAEVYAIIAFIAAHAEVDPAKLEAVLAARAERFITAAWEQRFSAADVMTVYRAARRIDPRAWRRIVGRWGRWRIGAARRRVTGRSDAA